MNNTEKEEIKKTESTVLSTRVRNYLCTQLATEHNELVIACYDELVQRGLKAERRVKAMAGKLKESIEANREYNRMLNTRKKIKPCPFCGGEPRLSKYEDESLWSHNIVTWSSVMCSNCDYIMNFCDDEDYSQAKKAWNHRADDWIPVSEKLPRPLNDVLLFREDKGIMSGYYDSRLKQWYLFYYNIWVNEVEYWRPLPEPPEET